MSQIPHSPYIEIINTYAAKFTISGWFIGLAYYNWLASAPAHVPIWAHVILISVGMFAVSIIVGGGMALLMALVTRVTTGDMEGSPHGFAWAALTSPVLAFFAAKLALQLLALAF